jgi:hypothetical protein
MSEDDFADAYAYVMLRLEWFVARTLRPEAAIE